MCDLLQEYLKLLNMSNVYSVYDVKLTVWFIVGILCETVLKCVMFFRSISLLPIINVPFHCDFRCHNQA